MTAHTTVNRASATPANVQGTKVSSGWLGSFGGILMIVGLFLLYLPAILPFVLASYLLRLVRH